MLSLSDARVEVEIAEVGGRTLGQRHLLVVEDHPLAVLQQVAHVVTHHRRRAHVTDEAHQAVLCRLHKR